MGAKTQEKFGIRRTDYTGTTQENRKKKNIAYELPDGQKMFAKFAKKTTAVSEPFSGLHREKILLDLLADTGVTPKPIELKVSKNAEQARLLLEQLPGKSFDSTEMQDKNQPLRKKPEAIIQAIGSAMGKIQEKGVLVVDVNEGTFLVDASDPANIHVNVLDFEIGVDLNRLTPEEAQRAAAFYEKKDMGLRLAAETPGFSVDATLLKQAEVRKTASVIVKWLLGGYLGNLKPVQLSPDRQAEYQRSADQYRSVVEKELKLYWSENYDQLRAKGSSIIPPTETKEHYVEKAVKIYFSSSLEQVLIHCTLQERIQQQGIELPKQTIHFLERALSPNIGERPEDFRELTGRHTTS